MNACDLAYLAALPLVAPVLAWRRLRHGKYRESIPAMWGRGLPYPPRPAAAEQRCWIHSVSVGETVAAGALFRELRRREPGWEFLATTTTETGQAQARRTYGEGIPVAYAPVDLSWKVRAFLRAHRPSLYIFLETEIWPNTLSGAAGAGLPIFMVNGKLSDRSARRYAALGPLFRPSLGHVRRFFMQTQQDAERMARVLGEEKRIVVTGNVKFDALPAPCTAEERAALRTEFGVSADDVLVLAGSTHPGEEEIVCRAFASARGRDPRLRLVLAPRHPERFGAVADLLSQQLGSVHRLSTGPAPPSSPVVMLDRMGVLARSFGAADIALLGGSWVPVGGHNLLEPAVHGIPVLRGPHMHAQREIVRVLGPGDGAPEIPAEALADALVRYSTDESLRNADGRRAQGAALGSRGAAGRTVDGILEEMAGGMKTKDQRPKTK